MSYRSDRDALETRRDELTRKLSVLRNRERELREVAEQTARVAVQLHEVSSKIGRAERDASLAVLEKLETASPCSQRWETMHGNERVRLCGECCQNVYDLSGMSRYEAEALVAAREGATCSPLFKRADGTVIGSDCTEGVRRKVRWRYRAGIAAVAFALVTGAGVAMVTHAQTGHVANGFAVVNYPRRPVQRPEPPAEPEAPERAAQNCILRWSVTRQMLELERQARQVLAGRQRHDARH